ncbi:MULTISPECIES: helix-turn-helix domain-containing protein [unclassified Oribacterium]|uniref:helix-turn-helix domain-containing protein n=1 Tax=unclassified Oribacterium TaxID=2629782 RepID=UPI0003F6D24A|nr:MULTISPECIES: helix-turn-helix transcriptional regulator [unclassified Oribacterium]SEA04295.1 Helix-turn-helix [Oribacterium sp. KHPX15]
MTTLNDFIEEQLKDPVFKEKYDALEPEYSLIQALIDARKENGMTQKQLADATGISQADISRLEHGTGNPSVKTLQRIAQALHMALKIEFVPQKETSIG